MNIYNFDVNFTTGKIYGPDLLLVVNDHNSATFKFTFDQEGRYIFKLLYPDNTIYVQDIVDGELVLTKGVLNQEGNYKFEISLYGDDNRLTTARIKEFPVRLELVETDEPVKADDRLPILDNLIEETNKVVEAAKNGEFDGATFTPSVSEDGDLSWSNDKGKDNPPTVNIKGTKGDPGSVKMQVVSALPDKGDTDTIYLLKKDKPGEQNIYDEYIYTEDSGWEHIGDTSVDLTDYYTKEETNNELNKKQNTLTAGDNITIENNIISASGNIPTFYLYTGKSTYGANGFNAVYTSNDTIFKDFKVFYDSLDTLDCVVQLVFNSQFSGDSGNIVCYCSADPNVSKADAVASISSLTFQSDCKYFNYSANNNGLGFAMNVQVILDSSTKEPTAIYVGCVDIPYLPITTTNNSNVINFTPTQKYHPATKKYVDDSVANASGGSSNYVLIDSSTSYNWSEVTQTLNSTENQNAIVSFMKDFLNGKNPAFIIKSVRTGPDEFGDTPNYYYLCNSYVYTGDNTSYVIDLKFAYNNLNSTMYNYGVGYNNNIYYTIEANYNATSNTASIDYYGYSKNYSVSSDAYQNNATPIGIGNSIEYSVTNDYQPAHKKYVDDAITTAITTSLEASY